MDIEIVEVVGLIVPDLKIYYKAIIIKAELYSHKDRHISGIQCKVQKWAHT